MSVSLETLVPQEEPVVVEETEEPPAPQKEEPPAPQEEEPPEEAPAPQVTAPAPKRRGRPRKDPAAPKKAAVKIKPPPPPVSPESSDGEPIDRDDMETLLLDYLIKRKQTQQDARRNMWATLAGLS